MAKGLDASVAVRALCRVDDLKDGDAKGFEGNEGSFNGLVAVRRGEGVIVYQNACPHIGTPLDWMPDQFLSDDRRYLICATHGAEFTIDTGECISGPCRGDYLQAVKSVIRDGVVFVPSEG
jgi:nitrite reductase/ring-hydroxylating ferredoxin subunit